MTPKFREEWRTIDPENPRSVARQYASRADARPDTKQFPFRVLQKRLVSDWEDDQSSPALPTLADMSPEERDDCQWMQADTAGAEDTCVLFVIGTRSAKGVAKGGRVTVGPHECFTPRPDLPRLEWPDTCQ